jgi:hypothetical protein
VKKGIPVIVLPDVSADSSSIAKQHPEKPFPEDPKTNKDAGGKH